MGLLVNTCKDLAGQGHSVFIAPVAGLKLRLTLSYESDDFNGSCPSMLNQCPVLNLDQQSLERLTPH
jgi:hypothetical protein